MLCESVTEEVSYECSWSCIGFHQQIQKLELHSKLIVPCESTAEEVSFEWSHRRMYPHIQNSETWEICSTFTIRVIFSIFLILKFLPWERGVWNLKVTRWFQGRPIPGAQGVEKRKEKFYGDGDWTTEEHARGNIPRVRSRPFALTKLAPDTQAKS